MTELCIMMMEQQCIYFFDFNVQQVVKPFKMFFSLGNSLKSVESQQLFKNLGAVKHCYLDGEGAPCKVKFFKVMLPNVPAFHSTIQSLWLCKYRCICT